MDDDQWVAPDMCRVSAARVEQLRVWLEQIIHRRFELDAWEMERQVLRDAQRGRRRNQPLQDRA
ncbi:hypothetical protein [Deinococcus marmoris]|uniref:Uncharacterized protein n=1 Tax=Deinococcus marmoris TaxID=249408 RepID=A0A1U7P195_9DEIO|nr:hypothetical protein [Deinococcus marmoris]OLV18947.1 hypothetical protein BOO71_0004246 [Deinococcus marmoris]